MPARLRPGPIPPAVWQAAGASLVVVVAYAGWRVLRGTPANVFPPLDGYAAKELLTRPWSVMRPGAAAGAA